MMRAPRAAPQLSNSSQNLRQCGGTLHEPRHIAQDRIAFVIIPKLTEYNGHHLVGLRTFFQQFGGLGVPSSNLGTPTNQISGLP